MSDEKQLDDAVERVVKKLHRARLNEITAAETEQDGEAARESEKRKDEAVVDQKPAPQPTAEIYSGVVKLLIARPVTHVQIGRFQERLGQVDGFQVKSAGGSSVEGPNIILLVEQPVPLLERLGQLDLVERVSKGKKGVEVTLKSGE